VQHLGELINADNSVSRVRQSAVTSQAVIDTSFVDNGTEPTIVDVQPEESKSKADEDPFL